MYQQESITVNVPISFLTWADPTPSLAAAWATCPACARACARAWISWPRASPRAAVGEQARAAGRGEARREGGPWSTPFPSCTSWAICVASWTAFVSTASSNVSRVSRRHGVACQIFLESEIKWECFLWDIFEMSRLPSFELMSQRCLHESCVNMQNWEIHKKFK